MSNEWTKVETKKTAKNTDGTSPSKEASTNGQKTSPSQKFSKKTQFRDKDKTNRQGSNFKDGKKFASNGQQRPPNQNQRRPVRNGADEAPKGENDASEVVNGSGEANGNGEHAPLPQRQFNRDRQRRSGEQRPQRFNNREPGQNRQKKDNLSDIGTWSQFQPGSEAKRGEEWDVQDEEWQGDLTESKIFTPSTQKSAQSDEKESEATG